MFLAIRPTKPTVHHESPHKAMDISRFIFKFVCRVVCNDCGKKSKQNQILLHKQFKMKATNYFTVERESLPRYEAPVMEVVEIAVERGFEASDEYGFDGPSYGEEDIVW